MNAKVLLLLALVAAAAVKGQSLEDSYGSFESYESEEPRYEYNYQVKDDYGNDFGHQEKRDGDLTEGSFYNNLPDGRLQKVKYYVDGYSGYVADVNYEGEARYDSGSYESNSRESNRRGYGLGSRESDESRIASRQSRDLHKARSNKGSRESGRSRVTFGPSVSRESRKPRTRFASRGSTFSFGSHESDETHTFTHKSRESKELGDDSRSLESRRHHNPVYYQPFLESSSKYDDDSDEDDDDDFFTSSDYFLRNYRPQIRWRQG